MMRGRFRLVSALFVAAMVLMAGTQAFAQGAGAGTLTGTVIDSSGAIIPGVDVAVKNNSTGAESHSVTDATGKFNVPSLPAGSYTVTMSLMGFKTVVLPDINVTLGTVSAIKPVTLEVGKLEETVTVQGATEIVQTQSATVATTLTTTQITNVPVPTRNTLDFVTSLPGVNTTGQYRNSTVMGLQASATNITIDGINVQDNYLKSSDGFFARINPRLDAVEEVSVSTANPGAESAGQGAVQIRFQTRSGTNKFVGSAYEYHREPGFNSNYWFNIRNGVGKDQIKINTWGVRQGGPVVIPGLFDGHDKLFFFVNFEQFHQPGTQSRTRTTLTQDAINGLFDYRTSGGRPVDVLALMTHANACPTCTTTADPGIMQFLTAVVNSAKPYTMLSTGNPITRNFTFQNPYSQIRRYPTVRMDYNITNKHRVGVSYYLQQYRSIPDTLNTADPRYPGFPGTGGQNSDRFSYMGNWRWTISSNMVSEVRGGITGGPVKFADGVDRSTWTQGPFSGLGGYIYGAPFISSAYTSTAPSLRDAPTYVLEDTLSWMKGKHGISFGASFTQVNMNLTSYRTLPQINTGLDTNDPANNARDAAGVSLWSTTSTGYFPGASGTDISNAKSLYAMLTGRLTYVSGSAYLQGDNTYKYMGDSQQLAFMRELGFYVQDAWRVKPNLTVTGGIRYEVQLPFVANNDYYSRPLNYANNYGVSGLNADGTVNLFNPAWAAGATPDPSKLQPVTQFNLYGKGAKAYNTNWKNFAPSIGAAWRPSVSGSTWLKKLLGADPVLRAGYSKAFTREGMAAVSGIYNANPGGSIAASRGISVTGVNNFAAPVLLRDVKANPALLPPGVFIGQPAYPLSVTAITQSTNEFYPDTATPYAHSFNLSFQRALNKNTAVDIRYVATRNNGGWWIGGRNLNEWNTIENGFLNEFKLAQANLAANIAAGRGANFKYYGTGTGTNPLPIFQAYLTGQSYNGASATTAASYTSSFYSNSGYLNYLALQYPDPINLARRLQTANGAYAGNAISAGLPPNFFVVNPGVAQGGTWVTGRPEDSNNNRYDALQVELRRRMTSGLLVQGSYQYVIRADTSNFGSLRYAPTWGSQGTPTHVVKANWVYELPFGQGKKFGGGVSRNMNRLVGGWSFDGNLRLQSGNVLDFGNVRLVGMTDSDLQKMFKLRFQVEDDGLTHVYMLPQDVIDNTIKAWNFDATNVPGATGKDGTGYAMGAPTGAYIAPMVGPTCVAGYTYQCSGGAAVHHYVTGPMFFRADMSVGKRVDLTQRVYLDLRVEAMNVFNNINFYGTTGGPGNGAETGDFEVTSAYRDSSNTQDPGGRLLQLSFRISW